MEGVEMGRAGHGFPWQKTGAAQPRFPLFGALPRGPSAASGGRSEAPSSSRNNSKKMVISVSPPQLETSRRNGPPASLPLRFLSSTPGAARAKEALPRPRARPGVRGGAACCPLPGGGRGIPLLPRGSRARFAACREGSVRRAPRRAAPSRRVRPGATPRARFAARRHRGSVCRAGLTAPWGQAARREHDPRRAQPSHARVAPSC